MDHSRRMQRLAGQLGLGREKREEGQYCVALNDVGLECIQELNQRDRKGLTLVMMTRKLRK